MATPTKKRPVNLSRIRRDRRLEALASCLALFAGLTTASGAASATLPDGTAGRIVGRGVQCVPYGSTQPSGPISYLASDAGKPGVPRIDAADLKMLMSIQHYLHSPRLRFAFVGLEFIVYKTDPVSGICMDNAPGYQILNHECNATYEPGERPDVTSAAPSCPGYPRPWMHGSSG